MNPGSALPLALLLAALVPATAVSQPVDTAIPLKIVAGKPVVDGVLINGQGPFRFLLDTGSQSNHIESGLARKLKLQATLQLVLLTPSGTAPVRGTRGIKVGLGSMEAGNQEFLFTNSGEFPQDIRGILGQEFLEHFDYTLDFQHHRLTVGEPPASGVPIGVQLIFGRMAVPTSLGNLVLDSGAEMLTLFRKSPLDANGELTDVSGLRMPVSIGSAPRISIGGRLYHPGQAEYHPVRGAQEAGLLPANIFHAIFVCNSKAYVVFDPQR